MIAGELLNYFNSKVLYVLDSENKNKALKYFSKYGVDSDNLVIRFARNLDNIINALSKEDYEFLFIDSNHSYKLNYTNIKTLQSKFNKLSVFCISINSNSSISEAANLNFETEYSKNVEDKVIGAYAKIYVDGVLQENDCSIFSINNSQDFKIFF